MGYYDTEMKTGGNDWFSKLGQSIVMGNMAITGGESLGKTDMGSGAWPSLAEIEKKCIANPKCTNVVIPSSGGKYLGNSYEMYNRNGTGADTSAWRFDSLGMVNSKRLVAPYNAAFTLLENTWVPGTDTGSTTQDSANACAQQCLATNGCDIAIYNKSEKKCSTRTWGTGWGQNKTLVDSNISSLLKNKDAPSKEQLSSCAWKDKACRDNCKLSADGCDGRFKAGCPPGKTWGPECAQDASIKAGVSDATYYNQVLAWCAEGNNHQSDFCRKICTADTGATSTADGAVPGGLKNACNAMYKKKCEASKSKPTTDTDDGGVCCSYRDPTVLAEYAKKKPFFDQVPGMALNPLCISEKCLAVGYKSGTMNTMGCVTSACANISAAAADTSAAQSVQLKQYCNATAQSNTSTNTSTNAPNMGTDASGAGGGDSGSGSTSVMDWLKKYWWALAIVGLLCLLAVSSVSLVMFKKDSGGGGGGGNSKK